MVRSFEDRPLPAPVVERILSAGLRSPSAGFTQGVDLVVLAGHLETARYWDATLDSGRTSFPWPGLLKAPLLVVVLSSEDVYRRRYAEADKGRTGDFDVPWWHVDAAFVALLLQLAAVDAGLGALFFQTHRLPDLRRALRIPITHAPVGTVAIGHPAADRPSSSVTTRPRRSLGEVVHFGHW